MKRSRLVTLGVIAILTLLFGQAQFVRAQKDNNAILLREAFEAVQGVEDVVNYRNPDNSYRVLSETAEMLAERISEFVVDDVVTVSGFGPATSIFGYSPTGQDILTLANAFKGNVAFFSMFDSQGTADALHEFIDGKVRGNQATLILNFGYYGSEVDSDGNRLPIVLPAALFGFAEDIQATGRCMFQLEKMGGSWKYTTFFFVLTPPELLFEAPGE